MLVENAAKLLVARPDFPLPNRVSTGTTEPIVFTETKFPHTPHSGSDGRDVAEEDVTENMIPPALAEVG